MTLSLYGRFKYYYDLKRAHQFLCDNHYFLQLNQRFPWFLQVTMLSNLPDYIGSLLSIHPIQNNKRAKMAMDCSPDFFFICLEKNFQEFLNVCTVQVAPIH